MSQLELSGAVCPYVSPASTGKIFLPTSQLGFRVSGLGFRVYWINVRDPFYFLGYGIPCI